LALAVPKFSLLTFIQTTLGFHNEEFQWLGLDWKSKNCGHSDLQWSVFNMVNFQFIKQVCGGWQILGHFAVVEP
jgi:hypothetical protein